MQRVPKKANPELLYHVTDRKPVNDDLVSPYTWSDSKSVDSAGKHRKTPSSSKCHHPNRTSLKLTMEFILQNGVRALGDTPGYI